ncbi:MAG: hypothetical protein R3A78_12875 [Polyangiales bacterium]
MERSDAKRWLAQRRAAAAREREARRSEERSPEENLRQGLATIELYASIHGWPVPPTEREQAEDLALIRRWARIRNDYRRGR